MQEATSSSLVSPTVMIENILDKPGLVLTVHAGQTPNQAFLNDDELLRLFEASWKNLSPKQRAQRQSKFPNYLVAITDGKTWDLERPAEQDGVFRLVTFDEPEGKDTYWHSASHLMAHAVKELWPDAQLAIGPPIDGGFYYDIDSEHIFTQEDFPVIEAKMAEITKRNLPIIRRELSRDEGFALFQKLNEPYKIELIEDLDTAPTVYEQGDCVDVCR